MHVLHEIHIFLNYNFVSIIIFYSKAILKAIIGNYNYYGRNIQRVTLHPLR